MLRSLVVSCGGRFRLWFGAGCLALVGALLKLVGAFDVGIQGMPPETGVVYIVAGAGALLISYAVLLIPQKYVFGTSLECRYLLWTSTADWSSVANVTHVQRSTSGLPLKYAIIAILANVPLVESFARIEFQSGRSWTVYLTSQQLSELLILCQEMKAKARRM